MPPFGDAIDSSENTKGTTDTSGTENPVSKGDILFAHDSPEKRCSPATCSNVYTVVITRHVPNLIRKRPESENQQTIYQKKGTAVNKPLTEKRG